MAPRMKSMKRVTMAAMSDTPETVGAALADGGSVSAMAAQLRKMQRAKEKAEMAAEETEAEKSRREEAAEEEERARDEEGAKIVPEILAKILAPTVPSSPLASM